jgi:N-acyl homoserine lactone hydrolase
LHHDSSSSNLRADARRRNDVTPLRLCDLTVEGVAMPVFAWAIATRAGTVLVDTGMIDSTPELDEEWAPMLHPWPDLGEVVAVVNTHLHVDHCGGNRRFAGTPTYVQRSELAAARAPDYLEEWVHFEGSSYVELDGDADLFDGISVIFTPGHSAGHQSVVVENAAGRVVLGGDVTVSMPDLVDGATESILRIHALRPDCVYLAHYEQPWLPTWDRVA